MELLYYPDPRLRIVAHPVKKVDDPLRETVRAMFQIMYDTRGIGLAAPQAGLGIRLIVANLTADPQEAKSEEVYINPEILERSGEIREEEACLSLPGLFSIIPRSAEISVRFTDLGGKTRTVKAKELHARLFEHEIDHLDGILIIDRLTPAERSKWSPLLKELESDAKKKVRRPRQLSRAGL
ncbi:MAG TPA: peptide deformylase [Planctomycetota bacterium]|nr:peptide deformylase [Planctomycetota bacterium]